MYFSDPRDRFAAALPACHHLHISDGWKIFRVCPETAKYFSITLEAARRPKHMIILPATRSWCASNDSGELPYGGLVGFAGGKRSALPDGAQRLLQHNQGKYINEAKWSCNFSFSIRLSGHIMKGKVTRENWPCACARLLLFVRKNEMFFKRSISGIILRSTRCWNKQSSVYECHGNAEDHQMVLSK